MSKLPEHVSAVAPLREAVDGSPRTARKVRKTAPQKPAVGTRWKCVGCGWETTDTVEQLRHVQREYAAKLKEVEELAAQQDELRAAIPAYAYEFNPQRLTLTADDIRRGHAAYMRLWRQGLRGHEIPAELRDVHAEHARRRRRGSYGDDPTATT